MMKHRIKYMGIMLAMFLLIALAPMRVVAGEGETELYVESIPVRKGNEAQLKRIGASYDFESHVLTLNNAKITGMPYGSTETRGIFSLGDLTIQLVGESTITVPDAEKESYGIYVKGNLTIKGEGSLTIQSGNINATATEELYLAESTGIYAEQAYVKDQATVVAKGGKVTVTEPENSTLEAVYGVSSGITVKYGVEVTGGSSVNASAGDTSAKVSLSRGIVVENGTEETGMVIHQSSVEATSGKAKDESNTGIAQSIGISVIGKIEIDFDGYLETLAEKAEGQSGSSMGIQAANCPISIYDGYLKAIGGESVGTTYSGSFGVYLFGEVFSVNDDKAVIELVSGDTEATVRACSNGLFVDEGSVVISAGNVNVKSGNWTSQSGNGYGICVTASKQQDGTFLGGTVSISCDDVYLTPYAGAFGFVGTKVSVTSETDSAIFSQMNIDIGDNLEVNGTVSGRGELDETTYWYEYYSLVDPDGKELGEVTIKPLIYKVTLDGMKMSIQVPVGKTANEVYCEKFGMDDLSERLNTEKEGYIFDGWYQDKEFAEDSKFTFDTPVYEDITLYGKWTEIVDDSGNLDDNDKDEPKNEINDKDEPKNEINDKDEPKNEINDKDDEIVNKENNMKEDAVSKVPQTGDNSMILFWIALFSISIMTMVVLEIKANK